MITGASNTFRGNQDESTPQPLLAFFTYCGYRPPPRVRSTLLLSAPILYGGSSPDGGAAALGEAAAAEAMKFMEWCCAIGMIAVFAEVT